MRDTGSGLIPDERPTSIGPTDPHMTHHARHPIRQPLRPLKPWWLAAALLCSACSSPPMAPAHGPASAQDLQPERGSGIRAKPGWTLQQQAVAAANPLAADAGLQILRAGGSAVDAAVAVQMVLTLVEPQSSGLGGGAFLLHHDGRRVQAYDGRETAPAGADETLFLAPDGKPMPFMTAVLGGRSVGVPGTLAMLAMAHRDHGRLPWARLFEPALHLAEDGFAVSPRLHTLLEAETALRADARATSYFYGPDGHAWPVGHMLRNPALAALLRRIANEGPSAFYEGTTAQAIVDKVRQHPANPGRLSLDDLRSYRAREREALCFDLRAAQRLLDVCGFPPPSSGAIAIGQILGLLARTPQNEAPLVQGLPSPDWLHSYTEASRLAFADRALYLADPDFVAPPAGRWASLLDERYLDDRARLLGPQRMPAAPAGQPGGQQSAWAPMPAQPEHGTSHISILDHYGNALAMTTTIEAGFGSRLMVSPDPTLRGGFLLNNELTDFSFLPNDAEGRPVANRVEPGKRPRSSMSPTLVIDPSSHQVLMSTGSPGGSFIIHFTAKTLHGVLHWGLTPQAAIDLPNFGSTGGPLMLEQERFPASTVQSLQALGHTVKETELTSGLQAIERVPVNGRPALLGGADPRREGVVIGD